MSSNFQAVARERFSEAFTDLEPTFDYPLECTPGCEAVVLMGGYAGSPLLPVRASFGILPQWAKGNSLARSTYNARVESVAEQAAFKGAWRHRQVCLVPVQQFYEPSYETEKPMRFGIRRRDAKPFALAGIWDSRTVSGHGQRSFSLLTINATDHPVMRFFGRPGEERRSVVIIPPDAFGAWLGARQELDLRGLLKPIDPELVIAEPQLRRTTDTGPGPGGPPPGLRGTDPDAPATGDRRLTVVPIRKF